MSGVPSEEVETIKGTFRARKSVCRFRQFPLVMTRQRRAAQVFRNKPDSWTFFSSRMQSVCPCPFRDIKGYRRWYYQGKNVVARSEKVKVIGSQVLMMDADGQIQDVARWR